MTIWLEAPFDSLPIEGYRKQRYWMMAEAFVRAGHRVVYWTSDFSHATKKKRVVDGLRLVASGGGNAFRLVMIPTRPYPKNVCLQRILSHRAYARTWGRMAKQAIASGESKPDVIIVSLPPVSTGIVGLDLARQFEARFVVDVQDAWPETFYRLLPQGGRWAARLLLSEMRREVRDVYRAADLVTGVCDRYEELVKGYGAKDYYRAYLGIEWDAKSRVEVEGRKATGEVIRLAYVGNLGVSYDLKTVIEGVRRMNSRGCSVTLDVAGFGGQIEGDCAVKFHGMLSHADLRNLLLKCDIGIIPMQADSFVGIPNKLAEYVAAGLKVVSSLQGETAELLAKYQCGKTYRAGSAESFANAVEVAQRLSSDAGRRLLTDELAAERIYGNYCKRICELFK